MGPCEARRGGADVVTFPRMHFISEPELLYESHGPTQSGMDECARSDALSDQRHTMLEDSHGREYRRQQEREYQYDANEHQVLRSKK